MILKDFKELENVKPVINVKPLTIGVMNRTLCCGMGDFYGIQECNRHAQLKGVPFGDQLLIEIDWAIEEAGKLALKHQAQWRSFQREYCSDSLSDEGKEKRRLYNLIVGRVPIDQYGRYYTQLPALLAMTYVDEACHKNIAEDVVKYVDEHKLGVVGVSDAATNPNSGNPVRGLMWSINRNSFFNRVNTIKAK